MLAALFGTLVALGKITQDDSTAYLGQATAWLGALGFVLAAFYTPGGPKIIGDKTDTPVEYSIDGLTEARNKTWDERVTTEVTVTPGPAPTVTIPLPTATEVAVAIDKINEAAGPTVAELRANLEARLRAR